MGWMPQPKDKDWMSGLKNKTPIYAVYKRPTSKPGTHTDWKGTAGKKIFWSNREQKKAGVAIFISDKIDFKTKAVKGDKEWHYIMIKVSIQEEDITIINIYTPNIGAPQYVRQMLTSMKGEINNNTIIVGDFNIPFTPMDISTKQKINKETQILNDRIDRLDISDIYRTFHTKKNEFHLFFKCTWNLLQDRSHLGP